MSSRNALGARILILGGTTEASALARALVRALPGALAGADVTLSLAGVTRHPLAQPVPVRRGGFGGATGLADYLRASATTILVDATHPFAATMSRHARQAAAAVPGVTLIVVRRPPWQPQPGDRWTDCLGIEAAAAALGDTPRRVLLTVGQKELAPFAARPWHTYIVRSVEPPPPAALPGATLIAATGPFALPDELALLARHRIERLVSKNSGGSATAAKLAAARALGLPVLMVARPDPEPAGAAPDAATALALIEAHAGTLLGV